MAVAADVHVRDKLFIGGEWVDPAGSETIDVVNASTEEVMGRIPQGTPEDVDRAVAAARGAFESWSETPLVERAELIRAVAAGLAARSEEIATTIAQELGMPIVQATAIQAGLPTMTFTSVPDPARGDHLERGDRELRRRARAGRRGRRDHALELPAAPDRREGGARACGRLHGRAEAERGHAARARSSSPRSSRRWASRRACSTSSAGTGPVVGEAIASHPDVDMVSFTGSTRAGRRVSELAAQSVKPVALELGGKSANVILDDADLETAVDDGVAKCFLNSGQTCSALTRMLVPRARLEEAERIAGADRRRLYGRRPASTATPRSARSCPTSSASACAATSARASRRVRGS